MELFRFALSHKLNSFVGVSSHPALLFPLIFKKLTAMSKVVKPTEHLMGSETEVLVD